MKLALQMFWALVLRPLCLMAGGVLLLVGLLFPGQGDLDFSTEEEQPALVSLPDASPLDRVAVVALFRAGFVRQVRSHPIDDPSERVASWTTSSFTDMCTFSELGRAVLASEGYARPAWRRNLEAAAATTWHAVTGHLPDWSYGLGQVRLSVAEAVLADIQSEARASLGLSLRIPQDRMALFAALQDRCQNSLMVETLLARKVSAGTRSVEAAEMYRGGRSWPVLPSIVSYEGLVARIADHVLPALREQGGELGITMKGAYVQDFSLVHPTVPTTTGPTPLMCLSDGFVDAYILSEEDDEDDDNPSVMIDGATLAAAAERLSGRALSLTLVPPDPELAEEEDELVSDPETATPDFYPVAEAALVLNRLSLLKTRPTLMAEGTASAKLRAAQPDCWGWLVLAEGPRHNWDTALREATGGRF